MFRIFFLLSMIKNLYKKFFVTENILLTFAACCDIIKYVL